GSATMLTQLGQELRAGEEDRAGEAGVGVWATLLHRQTAVTVRQGLGGDAVAGLGPLGQGEGPRGVDAHPLTSDVHTGGLLPSAAHRLIADFLWRTQIFQLSECPSLMLSGAGTGPSGSSRAGWRWWLIGRVVLEFVVAEPGELRCDLVPRRAGAPADELGEEGFDRGPVVGGGDAVVDAAER